MSRFSIRVQVMFLTAAFIATLLAVSYMSWRTNSQLALHFNHSRDVVEQINLLNEMKQDAEQGKSDLLSFAAGKDEAIEGLRGNLVKIVTNIDDASSIFLETQVAASRKPQVMDELKGLLTLIEDIQTRTDELAGKMLFDRKVFTDREIMPLFVELGDRIDVQQTFGKAEEKTIIDASKAAIQSGTNRQIISNGLVIVFALGLAALFGHLLSSPVRRAAQSVRRIADRDYAFDIPDLHYKGEVGEILRSLESLRGRLADAEEAEARNRATNDMRIDLFQTLGLAMSRLKGGDLASRIDVEEWQELGESYTNLCKDFNDLGLTLDELVASLRQSSVTVEGNARELSEMSDEMSRRAEVQAATLEESAAALDQLSTSVGAAAQKAQEADDKVVEGRRRAEEGGRVMRQAMTAMSSIAKSSDQITQIISVIDDIAFQTNLLALNAGVEAARAGESGKGFAVVASEVRGLAQRAAESANEIKDLVLGSTEQVRDGERLVQATGETLERIVESVTDVSQMVAAIATSAREQSAGVQEINVGVAELDKVTQQNAAMVGETSTSSQQLSAEASRLSGLLARFAGGKTDAASPPAGAQIFDARKKPAPAADDRRHHDPAHGTWADGRADPEPAPQLSSRPMAVGDNAVWKDF